MLCYFQVADASLWKLLFWVFVIPTVLVCLIVFLGRKFRKNTRHDKRNANPLSSNKPSDKEKE